MNLLNSMLRRLRNPHASDDVSEPSSSGSGPADTPAKDQPPADPGRARSYWEANPEAGSRSQWFLNPVISQELNRRMSGGESAHHWLRWIAVDYFQGRQFKAMLSPGCGTGSHELLAARFNLAERIDAFDFSEASLQIARQKAMEEGHTINFYRDDLNTFELPPQQPYDLVMCSGSLHHVREIERFLSTVRSALTSDGYFVVNEYVGACYNLYDRRQVDLINRIYRCFSEPLRSGLGNEFTIATIDDAIRQDPSESVRSTLIPPLLEHYFDIEVCHRYGGGLLHPLYPFLNHAALLPREDIPQIETLIRVLMELEQILMDMPGGLQTDFALYICRLKR
jgi:O-antigen biosynthesis protein